MSSNTIGKAARQLATHLNSVTPPTVQKAARTLSTSPTATQFAEIAGAPRRASQSGPMRPMSTLPPSSHLPFAGFAKLYGEQGRLAKMPDSAKSTSANVDWATHGETQKSRDEVSNVVVIGYAEGSELLAAKSAYANASVKGIETDAKAVDHAQSLQSGDDSQPGIQVTKPMDFSSAVVNGHVKPGSADRIVMAYVAPYMDNNALANTFANAAHVQKDGDRFSMSTYGSRHAHAGPKNMNIRSASDMIKMANENGYVLDKARVQLTREGQQTNEKIATSPEELIDHDLKQLQTETPDAWHTMELTFRKDSSVLDE